MTTVTFPEAGGVVSTYTYDDADRLAVDVTETMPPESGSRAIRRLLRSWWRSSREGPATKMSILYIVRRWITLNDWRSRTAWAAASRPT